MGSRQRAQERKQWKRLGNSQKRRRWLRAYRKSNGLPSNNRGFSKPATAAAKADIGAMEAINEWLKDELFSDFSLNELEDVEESVRAYVEYFNERRPAFALGYLTPKQFMEKFYRN